MLISGLLVAVKTSQPTSIDVYDSREIETTFITRAPFSYRRSPFNVETNALLGIGRAWFVEADQVQLWKTSSLAGFKRWTGSTAQSDDAGFGPTWSKIQSIVNNSKGIERFCLINSTVCGCRGKWFLG
jgi:hypothetical protein